MALPGKERLRGLRRSVPALLAAAALAWALGCGYQQITPAEAELAVKVVDRLNEMMRRGDHHAALACFTADAQVKVRKAGGPNTPLHGFFGGLSGKLKQRTGISAARGAVWATYRNERGELTHVALIRNADGQWLISAIRGDDWRI